jgi:hypothetical protein
MALLYKKARQVKGNQNEVLLTVISQSLKQYLARYTSDKTRDMI